MQTSSLFESIQPRYPEFKNQVALITGSSRGIGKGIALRLAREGMKIVIHGVDATEIEATTQELQALGVDTQGVHADFNSEDDIKRLFQASIDRFGTLNLLVNNAADLRRRNFFNGDLALLDHQIAVNIRAPYLCAHLAAEIMRPAQYGNILNISSVGGLRAHWTGLPYDITKGALDAMTRAMALELAREGIRVNAIAPGATQSEKSLPLDDPRMQALVQRIPLARLGTPLDVGAMVAFLASSDASYITGQIFYVDGGVTTQLSPPGQPI
ncbi:MAG: glucose 1-dehydrogenase [Anaerolineae bacterium]|nr:glucose 1-dehydrogenase [Anaerolineae bacterium]